MASGLKLGEKGLRAMYEGLDGELDDWLEVPPADAFRLSLSIIGSPLRLARLVKTLAKELFVETDRFGADGIRRLSDIGGSPAFHAMSPEERRRIAGFPEPREYFIENVQRRRGRGTHEPIRFPDPDWSWLPLIERFANIPCRSVHMLEFAVALAKEKGLGEVSLFTGEIHNSDMDWYQRYAQGPRDLPDWAETEIRSISWSAAYHAKVVAAGGGSIYKAMYGAAMLAGLAVPVVAYTFIVNALVRYFL